MKVYKLCFPSLIMGVDKYTPLEENYAIDFYRRIGNSTIMSKLLGGLPPCSRTGNKVFFDYHGIENMISFHEFDGRCIKLKLQMWIKKEGAEKTESLDNFPCLGRDSARERINDIIFKRIIEDFYIPSIKYFYDLYGPKQ